MWPSRNVKYPMALPLRLSRQLVVTAMSLLLVMNPTNHAIRTWNCPPCHSDGQRWLHDGESRCRSTFVDFEETENTRQGIGLL